jgi:hypothetical protein
MQGKERLRICLCGEARPFGALRFSLEVRKYVTRAAIKKHNTFEKHDSVHRDCDTSWALFGLVSGLKIIVPFDSEDVAPELRRKRAGVTNFSTRGGAE